MERNEVSLHQLKVFLAVRKAGKWLTNREISVLADVAERTARQHSLFLVNLGILDQADVFPAHKYKYSELADKRNKAYVGRLCSAIEVFGEDIPGSLRD